MNQTPLFKTIAVIASLDRQIIEKKISDDIDAIIEGLAAELKKSHTKAVKMALAEIVRQLYDLPTDADAAAVDAILAIGDKHLDASISAAIRDEIDRAIESAYLMGMREIVVDAVFGAEDLKSLAVLQSDIYFWADTYYQDNIKDKLADELREYFGEGLTRDRLAKKIEVAFTGVADSGSPYFDLLADHVTMKTREIGRVSGYELAGVKKIVVKAYIDDRTTDICRRLNGTVIETIYLRKQVDSYLEACTTKDKEKIKAAWPWMTDEDAAKLESDKALTKAIKSGKVGLPPYHAYCRTITVAELS